MNIEKCVQVPNCDYEAQLTRKTQQNMQAVPEYIDVVSRSVQFTHSYMCIPHAVSHNCSPKIILYVLILLYLVHCFMHLSPESNIHWLIVRSHCYAV